MELKFNSISAGLDSTHTTLDERLKEHRSLTKKVEEINLSIKQHQQESIKTTQEISHYNLTLTTLKNNFKSKEEKEKELEIILNEIDFLKVEFRILKDSLNKFESLIRFERLKIKEAVTSAKVCLFTPTLTRSPVL